MGVHLSMSALAACLTLLLTTPSGAQTSEPLRVVVPAIPSMLDPHKAVLPVDLAVSGELFMGLVTRDANGEIAPGVAHSWDISPDGLTYTFTLRYGAKWSDGRRVSPGDFVAGFARALDPETAAPYASDLLAIKGAQGALAGRWAPSELDVSSLPFRKLRISLDRPSARFLEVLGQPVAAPVPRHAMKNSDRAWTVPGSLVNNGAFTAAESDEGIELDRNPIFFDADNVKIERVEFVAVESASQASRLVRDDLAHLTLGFPFEIESGPTPLSTYSEEGQGIYFVAVNVQRSPLSVREVRHALAMTIDREALIRQLHLTGVTPAYKMVPPDVLTESLSPRAPYAALRPGMRAPIAKVLLSESNISLANPRTFKWVYPRGDVHDAVVQRIAQTWATLGVQVTADAKPAADYDQILAAGTFDLALAYWPRGSPSPTGFLDPLARTAGPLNMTGYAEPDFDRYLQAADMALDDMGRPSLLAAAEGVLIQDQVILPIFFFKPRHAVAAHVRGWAANAYGIHPLRFLSLQ